jgi:hypothetical protein
LPRGSDPVRQALASVAPSMPPRGSRAARLRVHARARADVGRSCALLAKRATNVNRPRNLTTVEKRYAFVSASRRVRTLRRRVTVRVTRDPGGTSGERKPATAPGDSRWARIDLGATRTKRFRRSSRRALLRHPDAALRLGSGGGGIRTLGGRCRPQRFSSPARLPTRSLRQWCSSRTGIVIALLPFPDVIPSCDVPDNRALAIPAAPAVDYMGWATMPPLPPAPNCDRDRLGPTTLARRPCGRVVAARRATRLSTKPRIPRRARCRA